MNYVSILVAAVAAFIIGWMWHGPLFGKIWVKLAGITVPTSMTPEVKKMMFTSMAWSFVMQLVTAFVMATLAGKLGLTDAMGAITLAFWAWLGFIVTSHINPVLWENKKIGAFYFGAVYHLVLLCVVSLIVVLWR